MRGLPPVGSRPLQLRASKVRSQNERPFLVALVSGLKFGKARFILGSCSGQGAGTNWATGSSKTLVDHFPDARSPTGKGVE
jgi:hypothetical protein